MGECDFKMISKKRLTLSRSFKVVLSLISIIVALHVAVSLYNDDSPLDFQRKDATPNGLRLSKNVGQQRGASKSQEPLRPCKLHRLRNPESKTRVVPAECKRLEPVPGSCDIADKLFHSRPAATCEHQKTHTFCTLTRNSSGAYGATCHPDRCKSQLSAATVATIDGKMLWKRFRLPSLLENWISQLLRPSNSKKHFGFVYIACGEDIKGIGDVFDRLNGYIGDEVPDEEEHYEALQLLILPPSEVVHTPEHGTPIQKDTDVNPLVREATGTVHGIHGGIKHNGIDINILLIDSVSNQHFFRSLPQTVQFLEKLRSNKRAKSSVFDFELFQAVRSRTFETLQALFAGEIDPSVKPFGTLEYPPKPLKVEHLLKKLKQQGYSTVWIEDLCYRWEWGLPKDLLVHNKSLTRDQIWRKFQSALSHAHIDSVEVMYSMCKVLSENSVPDQFHGPDAVCLNGRHQHEYILEYLSLYQDTMSSANQPFVSIFSSNVAHEGTGRRLQTMDSSLKQYLQHAARQKNTLTIVFSDHGNAYGDFLQETSEGRVELFHPFLLMIVPEQVAASLGKAKMKALQINQHRLISVLDLHYMLQAIATNFKNAVALDHSHYNVTNGGLLDEISPHRTCTHIPRIMPNVCICENFDMPADSDDYHALFAHLAIARLNNEIQRQFHRTTLPHGVSRAFGHCQRLHLMEFRNVMKSFSKSIITLKMDLLVPFGEVLKSDFDPDALMYPNAEPEPHVFLVSMQANFGREASGSRIILDKVDRISPYSKFSKCADNMVAVQLCLCDTSSTQDSALHTKLPTIEELSVDMMDFETEILAVNNTDRCLYLIQHRNDHGGLFSVANVCPGKVFYFLFELEVSEMYVSDKVPIEDKVFPGQEIFLCMAIKKAPKAKWSWSFSLRHRVEAL